MLRIRRIWADDLKRWVGAIGVFVIAVSAACGTTDDPATAPPPGSTFSITVDPNTVRIGPGGSAVSVATIRGGTPPVFISLEGVPNGVSVRVASTEVPSAFKLIITADASVVPGTYAIGIRCNSSGDRPDATTQLALTVPAA